MLAAVAYRVRPHSLATGLAGAAVLFVAASSLALPEPTVGPALVALSVGGVAVGHLAGRVAGGDPADRTRAGRTAGIAAGATLAVGVVGSAQGWLPRATHSALWELHFLLATHPPPTWLPIPGRLRDEAALGAAAALVLIAYAVEGAVAGGATGDQRRSGRGG